ncbi:MAG: hypothetical protein JJV98_00700 [Desulfosarcina sp.]|nr:hypothetical protein [Desulfobacterales bacterium]
MRKIGTLGARTTTRAFIKASCCSAMMGLLVTRLMGCMYFDPQADLSTSGLKLLTCVAVGLAGYLILSWLCRSRELGTVYRIVRHKGLGI